MGNLRIGIDLDGSLLDYQLALMRFINANYEGEYKFEEIKRPDCYDILGNPVSRAIKLANFCRYTNFLLDMPPVEGSQEAVRKLKEGGNALFNVTSRFWIFYRPTNKCLENNFGKHVFERTFFSYVLASDLNNCKARRYMKLGLDIVVEDSPSVASACSARKIPVILLSRPWNQGFEAPGVTRAQNWQEIDDMLRKYARTGN